LAGCIALAADTGSVGCEHVPRELARLGDALPLGPPPAGGLAAADTLGITITLTLIAASLIRGRPAGGVGPQ
jgi:hypothetical protein